MATEDIREILSKLVIRKANLIREAAALDNLIGIYQGLVSAASAESVQPLSQLDLYRKPTPRAVQAAETADMIEVARKIIIEAGHPMKRGELVRRLEGRGFKLPGRDKNKVFGTNIWRSGKFRTIDDRGYWPKDVRLPKNIE